MGPDIVFFMTNGNIVEYIDQQKIIAAVILQEKKGRLKLLNENNREVNSNEKRLSHISRVCMDTSVSRDSLVKELKSLAQNRINLSQSIDIKELWELLHEESGEIDIPTMTLFCFDPPLSCDHESAVIRAFFNDRLYFKFNKSIFTAFTPAQVEAKKRALKKEAELITQGAAWIKDTLDNKKGAAPPP